MPCIGTTVERVDSVERPFASNCSGRTALSVTTMHFLARMSKISRVDRLLKLDSEITWKIEASGLPTWGGTNT
jgi:hypothetical protein